MIKTEWREILHNWWYILVLIVICLIPTIYTSIFLGSMWDPYGNTQNINVAIVNNDQAAVYQNETLRVGDDLCKNLLNNDSMHFVVEDDENKAMEKLNDGTYAMVITIPKNFSSNATTLLADQPQKMKLTYTTNPGNNYVASKMDETAIQNIQKKVSEEVTKTYTKTLFASMQSLVDGLQQTATGTAALQKGVTQLEEGSSSLSDNLNTLANSTLTLQNGTTSLEIGLRDYTNGVIQVQDGMYTLDQGLSVLQSSLPTLQNGIVRLQNGSVMLTDGIQNYTQAVNTLYQGNSQLVNNSTAIQNAMQTIGKASEDLTHSNQSITDGLSTLSSSVDDALSSDKQEITNNIISQNAQLSNAFEQEKNLASSSNTSIQAASTSLNQLNQLLTDTSIDTMSEEEMRTLLLDLKQQIQETSEASQKAFTQSAEVNTILLGNRQDNTTSLIDNTQKQLNYNTALIQQLTSGLKDFQVILNGGTLQNQTVISTGLLEGSQQIQAGLQQLQNSIQSSDTSKQTLSSSLTSYFQGVSQIQNGLDALNSSSTSLVSGGSELQTGIQSLYDKTPDLTNGILSLNNGSHQLLTAGNTLISNNQSLLNGAHALSTGTGQLQTGSLQLYDGSLTLWNGLKDAKNGISTLSSTLNNKVQKIQVSSTDKTYDMMASPIALSHQEISTVENNGNAMAPYMMSVALYVAAMAFTLMYPLLKNISASKSGFRYWVAKASVMYGVSTLAAILMVGLLMLINGLSPVQTVMTFIFAVLVSAAFMSMIVFFNIAMGRIGEFLMLIFMVINLGGSAGTYPLETSPKLYQLIHPFVPFTYSVNGFRHLLSMEKVNITQEILFFIGMIVLFACLSILYYKYRRKHPKYFLKEAFPKE